MRGLFNRVISHTQRQFHSTIEKKNETKRQNKEMNKKNLYVEKILFGIKLSAKLFSDFSFSFHQIGHVKTI